MKFIHLSCIALIGIILVNSIRTKEAPIQDNQQSIKSFSSLCKQKHALSEETKYTINILLQQAGTVDCDRAERKLNKRQILDLSSHQISDLSPLAPLTNLTELYLSYNQIKDLSPLSRLTNLNFLFLESNQISDLSPLSQLNNLNWLFVGGNPINNKTCPVKPESICEFEENRDEELLVPEETEIFAQLLR
ncbi:MAG: leucine-rich repeat domain-containing protein [Cyanobacteria bacterium P01_D01_bin.116]